MPIPSRPRIGSSSSAVDDRAATQAGPDAPERDGFGHHFDTARRQGGHKAGAEAAAAPSPASMPDAKKTPASAGKPASKRSDASGKDGREADDKTKKPGDESSLAAAMLDLFGATKQALPASVATGSAGAGDQGYAGVAGAAVTGAAGCMAAMTLVPGAVVPQSVDAAAQAIAADAADGTTAGDGTKTTPGGLAAILVATTLQAAGSMADAGDVDSLAPHRENQPGIESMPMNGLAAGVLQGTTPATHALTIAAPAGSAPFAQELGQHIVWLGGQTLKQANIRLHPEQLGSLDVKVSVTHDGHVDVSFTAQHPAAVTAVQQSLGQLNLMLAGQGLSLGQAQVGQQGAGQQSRSSGRHDAVNEADAAIDPLAPLARPIVSVGLLDTFA